MDKDKIMNYWDQLAHLTFLCHADNIMHGNETGYPLLVQQILHIQFATVMIGDMESTLLIDAADRANFDLPQIPEPDGSYVLNQKL